MTTPTRARMLAETAVALAVILLTSACGEVQVASDEARPEPVAEPAPETEPEPEPEPAPRPDEDLEDLWSLEVVDVAVTPQCCGAGMTGPVSPAGTIPEEGWPADGWYDARVERLAEPPAGVRLTLSRLVPCDHLDACIEGEPQPDEVVPDPATAVTRTFTWEGLTVVVLPISPYDPETFETIGIVGSDVAFVRLLAAVDSAFVEWVVDPYVAGATVEQIEQEMVARSTDLAFPFGLGEETTWALGYRAPHDTLLRTIPSWLGPLGRWPPGANGLYDWWTVLEVRDGAPILYVAAGQIAG